MTAKCDPKAASALSTKQERAMTFINHEGMLRISGSAPYAVDPSETRFTLLSRINAKGKVERIALLVDGQIGLKTTGREFTDEQVEALAGINHKLSTQEK